MRKLLSGGDRMGDQYREGTQSRIGGGATEEVPDPGYSYRKDYGSAMTDESYKALNEGLEADTRILDKAQGEVNKSRDLDSAFSDWWKEDKVQVRATEGQHIHKIWEMPRSLVKSYIEPSGLVNAGDGTYPAAWVDDNIFNIDVKLMGVDEGYGLELGQQLDTIKTQARDSFYKEQGPKILKQAESNQKILDKNKGMTQETLNTIQRRYRDKIKRISDSIKEIM